MGWTLSQAAFIVACLGASGANVEINADGLTVKDGKFYLMKGENIVFEVDLDGICNAIGGFIVQDGGKNCCKISIDGINITNANGYTGLLTVAVDYDRLDVPGALYVYEFLAENADIKSDLQVEGMFDVSGISSFSNDVKINGGKLYIDGKTLTEIIDARIAAHDRR